MHVKIYIVNTQKSPKTRCGYYGYVLACEIRGELHTKEGFGRMEGTKNQIDLTACVEALSRMKRPSEIEIIGDFQWLSQQVQYLEIWEKSGWNTVSGNPVKNMELWQEFLKKYREHKIQILLCKNHPFLGWITVQIKRRKDEKNRVQTGSGKRAEDHSRS